MKDYDRVSHTFVRSEIRHIRNSVTPGTPLATTHINYSTAGRFCASQPYTQYLTPVEAIFSVPDTVRLAILPGHTFLI
jgi:hypothetical protein